MRLQCYEGLDEAKALYEWNYRKQLLRIQAESDGAGWGDVQEDIFGEEFLLERPLMTAIASPEPVVLLIDEIDKTDQEFEAMLLELLSDFQISIPELGRIEARTQPVVLLTSNNTRELTEALKRRCLYLWLDYPALEHELEIVRLHSPDLGEMVARKLVEIVHQVRDLDLKKPPSIAESIDWARALLLLGAERDRRAPVPGDDERDRQAPHRPRHGRRAGRRQARADAAMPRLSARRPIYGGMPEGAAGGLRWPAARLRRGSARGGRRDRNLGVARRLRGAAARPLDQGNLTFAETLAATFAKSPEDRRMFDLVFERFFFRAAEAEARAWQEVSRGRRRTAKPIDIDLDALRQQIAAALAGRVGGRYARPGPARDRGVRAGEGSGVLGVDVQRIRRALGLRTEPQPDLPEDDPRRRGLPREQLRRFEQPPAPRARARR